MVRFKNRYLLCSIDCEPHMSDKLYNVEARELQNAIRYSVSKNFGDFAIARVSNSLAVKTWSPALSLCLVRCHRDHFRTVWAAITLLSNLHPICNVAPVRFSVIHVGGTMRSCTKTAVEHGRHLILEARTAGNSSKGIERASTSLQHQMQQDDS